LLDRMTVLNQTTYLRSGETADLTFLNSFLKLLRKQRVIIYVLPAIVLIVTLVVALRMPDKYIATAKTMRGIGKSPNVAASMAIMIPSSLLPSNIPLSGSLEGNIYLELLRSNPVTDSVLMQVYTDSLSVPKGTLPELFGTEKIESARQRLKRISSFSHDRKSGVISIQVETTDPDLSAQIVNNYIKQLNYFRQSVDRKTAERASIYFEERLVEQKKMLSKAEEKQTSFLAKNRNYQRGDDPELMLEVERLGRNVVFHRQLLLSLMQLKTNSDMERLKNTPNLTVLEWAQPPMHKSGPYRTRIVFLATIGAILFAIGLVILQVACQWYIPATTQQELVNSCNSVGEDVRYVVNRVRHPLRTLEKADV